MGDGSNPGCLRIELCDENNPPFLARFDHWAASPFLSPLFFLQQTGSIYLGRDLNWRCFLFSNAKNRNVIYDFIHFCWNRLLCYLSPSTFDDGKRNGSFCKRGGGSPLLYRGGSFRHDCRLLSRRWNHRYLGHEKRKPFFPVSSR